MLPAAPIFDANDSMHGHVDFLTALWCWDCSLLFERPDWGPTAETFFNYCADVSERAKATGWVMLEGHPRCPVCAAKRPAASPTIAVDQPATEVIRYPACLQPEKDEEN